ncbi:hypothetical protein T10_2744 [Trichinella papuae]|uniref:Uncharacterized protein n=1 Tax=Trichinella papuae TaxID=268474 RepID=A0A0V1MCN6_9BILA|nr:hypothetical protein T10_2744 [Trichinella papuae]
MQTKNVSYKRPMHLKMYHLLIRVQDKMRLLRRFSSFIFICTCIVTFYLSYFIGAWLMYPDEPANLYEWNKRKEAGQLSESSLEKERLLNMWKLAIFTKDQICKIGKATFVTQFDENVIRKGFTWTIQALSNFLSLANCLFSRFD